MPSLSCRPWVGNSSLLQSPGNQGWGMWWKCVDEQHAGFGVFLAVFTPRHQNLFLSFWKFVFLKHQCNVLLGPISMLSPGERIAKMNFLQIKHDLAILEGLGRTCPAVGSDISMQTSKNLPEAQMPQVNYHGGGPTLERSNLGRILSFPHQRDPTYLEKAAVSYICILCQSGQKITISLNRFCG